MAVTGDLFKGFTFGSISSKDYDVYITQESAYDAPERDVEFIDIAGRNGSYVLDKGRFLNIQVSYRCGIVGDDDNVFKERIRTFRNALASQIGYQRLTDDYHDTRYREAVFTDGINVEMADRQAGEFTVTFNCKPQRFRTDGESRLSIYEGTTVQNTSIFNPTRFDARPLIDFNASADGSFTIGDYTISVVDALLGKAPLSLSKTSSSSASTQVDTLTINNTGIYNAGDTFTIEGLYVTYDFAMRLDVTGAYTSDVVGLLTTHMASRNRVAVRLRSETISFVAGTASTTTLSARLNVIYSGSLSEYVDIAITVAYDGDDTISFSMPVGLNFYSGSMLTFTNNSSYSGEVNSTLNTLTETIYLDCETGNAYSIVDGSVVSMNNHVGFGAEIPVLPSGLTTVSRSAAITNLGITPRWWEV